MGTDNTADSGVAESAGVMENGAASDTAPAPAAAPEPNGDYSETNTQVAGVDEGDIVKTDGKYIYVLHDNTLKIFEAAGADTKLVSDTVLFEQPENEIEGKYESFNASQLYISGTRLAVILYHYSYEENIVDERYFYDDSSTTELRIYDVSQANAPVLLSELGQDGDIISTRLIGSTLYMVSSYYVHNFDENDPGTYIPRVYAGDRDGTLLEAGCIAVMPEINSSCHTVICSYNLENGSISDTQSLLGGASDIYMNSTSLYVYNNTYSETVSEPRTESVYSVTDHTSGSQTEIYRYDLSGGLTLSASGTVEGSPVNQFALDEKDGYLRIVTTVDTYSWTEYRDETMDFTNHVSGDDTRYNSLYVLDSSLSPVGGITNLAKDERVYSVRFDGDIGYFVTFRNVDPLFSVDLTDPTNPVILGDLKIPGFSQYLHVYGDGLLFGLGMNADEETGRTDGMKLSMFDTSNPADVTEKHTLSLDSDYSEALYNHKAILISPEKNIIGFPTEMGYAIYGYASDSGFFPKSSIEYDSDMYWSGDCRGLYIGSFAYIITYDRVLVLDMENFNQTARIDF